MQGSYESLKLLDLPPRTRTMSTHDEAVLAEQAKKFGLSIEDFKEQCRLAAEVIEEIIAEEAKESLCPECNAQAHRKSYLGNQGHYFYCPKCKTTFGGEETPAKKALLAAAITQDPGEQGEVEGLV